MHLESVEMLYRIGGRLDVIPTVEAAATMLRALDAAAVRLPPLGGKDGGDQQAPSTSPRGCATRRLRCVASVAANRPGGLEILNVMGSDSDEETVQVACRR